MDSLNLKLFIKNWLIESSQNLARHILTSQYCIRYICTDTSLTFMSHDRNLHYDCDKMTSSIRWYVPHCNWGTYVKSLIRMLRFYQKSLSYELIQAKKTSYCSHTFVKAKRLENRDSQTETFHSQRPLCMFTIYVFQPS